VYIHSLVQCLSFNVSWITTGVIIHVIDFHTRTHKLSNSNYFVHLALGDRLTDERVQCAQQSVLNGETPEARLEGFISKIEDFHRLMNFLEVLFLTNLTCLTSFRSRSKFMKVIIQL
jgi:hypothetical protein